MGLPSVIEAIYQFVTTTGNRAAVGSLDKVTAVGASMAGTQVNLDSQRR
jgi:carbamate kinase